MTRLADTLRHSPAPAACTSSGGGTAAAVAVAALAALALYLRLSGAPPAASGGAAVDGVGAELVTLTPLLGSYFGTAQGVLVVRAAADRALGLEDGDVILAIDGRLPASGTHATRMLSSHRAGDRLVLRIVRRRQTLNVVATLPNTPPAPRRQVVMFGPGRA